MHRFYRIVLISEAPALGCGYRLIFLHQEGPKWAKLRDVNTLRSTRIARTSWDKLKAHISTRKVCCPRNKLQAVFAAQKREGKTIPKEAREMLKYAS